MSQQNSGCYNPECQNQNPKPAWWKPGWQLRNGDDLATLCHSCGSIYEVGIFCETFHKRASGWRCCESCGKKVHCGCIVSVDAIVLLDAGGIECLMCARKSAILAQANWHPRRLPNLLIDDIRNCNQTVGSASRGPWQQELNLFSQSGLESRMSIEADLSATLERLAGIDQLEAFQTKRSQTQGLLYSTLKFTVPEMVASTEKGFCCKEESCSCSCLLNPVHQPSLKDGQPAQHLGLAFGSLTANEKCGQDRMSGAHLQLLGHVDSVQEQLTAGFHDGVASPHQTQICMSEPEDVQVRKKLLFKTSDEKLELNSQVSACFITPLFENVLRTVRRLTVPKKCAEPEGVALEVQDIKGKEWMFQFRFWLNRKSRIYILEGMANFIRSWQLEVGDTVTFSRRESDGKFIMGFKRALTEPKQGVQAGRNSDEMHSGKDIGNTDPRMEKAISGSQLKAYKNLLTSDDIANKLSKNNKPGVVAKDVVGTFSSVSSKRKKLSSFSQHSKQKCYKMNKVDMLQLEVTLEEAQDLLIAPATASGAPKVVMIEDFEFEEYEDAPVIGRPKIIAKDSIGFPSDTAQELTLRQIKAASRELKNTNHQALVHSTIQDDPAPVQLQSRHPNHKPGCLCIVCLQAVSGNRLKHRDNCICNLCMILKRRLQTMMLRRKSDKVKEATETQDYKSSVTRKLPESDGRINLQIQARAGHASIGCDPTTMIRMFQEAAV